MARGRLPHPVPSATIERKCGSGQQAVDFAAWGIAAGVYDIAIAGGVESMSRVPMGSARMGADPFGPRVRERFPDLVPQGVSAELVADKWGLTREQLDEFSARVAPPGRGRPRLRSLRRRDRAGRRADPGRDDPARLDGREAGHPGAGVRTEQYRRQFPHLDLR